MEIWGQEGLKAEVSQGDVWLEGRGEKGRETETEIDRQTGRRTDR